MAENNTSAVDEPAVEQCLTMLLVAVEQENGFRGVLAEHTLGLEISVCPCTAWQLRAPQH